MTPPSQQRLFGTSAWPLLALVLVLLWPLSRPAASGPPGAEEDAEASAEATAPEPAVEPSVEPSVETDPEPAAPLGVEVEGAGLSESAGAGGPAPAAPEESRRRRGRRGPRRDLELGSQSADLQTFDCSIENPGDPLAPAIAVLDALDDDGLEVEGCRQVSSSMGPRLLEATVRGRDQALVLYRLEGLAADGFEVFVAPQGTHEVLLGIRPAIVGASVYYLNVDAISLHGSFMDGDDRARLELVIGLQPGNFYPFEYASRLAELGYRAEFLPVRAGEVVIEVRPGRAIRRVRVRGHVPLAKRDVTRQLSVQAQPGALARGECIEPSRLREALRERGAKAKTKTNASDPLPDICGPQDKACQEWRDDEVERIDAFLFDSGYFKGHASLALVCGREVGEADLHVILDKGPGFRVARRRDDKERSRGVVVEEFGLGDGQEPLAEARDQRWIRRQFVPKVLGLFRTRITREFMDKAVERVERAYAEPRSNLGAFWTEGSLPYPEVQVRSSYDELTPETDFRGERTIPVDVAITRGPGVQTEFRAQLPTRPSRAADGEDGRSEGLEAQVDPSASETPKLRFSDAQLRAQLQLFNRREPATPAAARRESANLRAFYQSKGYLFASVEGSYLDFKSIDKLRFDIREGPKVKVADLELIRPAQLLPAAAKRIEKRWDDERALRRSGRFTEADALADIQALIGAYNAEGYLCARVEIELAFWKEALDARPEEQVKAVLNVASLLDNGGSPSWLDDFDAAGLQGILAEDSAKVWVRFRVRPGPRVVTSATEEVRYLDQRIPFSRNVEGLDRRDPESQEVFWGAPRMLRGGPLRRPGDEKPGGLSVTPSLDREARNAIVRSYRNSGFAVADAELTWGYTDRRGNRYEIRGARNLPEQVCSDRSRDSVATVDPIVNVYEGRKGEFGDILFRGNFKTQPYVLRRELKFETGQAYSQDLADRSAASIEATGVARTVTITPYPVGCHWDEAAPCQVHQLIAIEEAKDVTMAVDFGFGAATLNPFYVFAEPSFPNIAGTAWDLNLEGRYGFDISEGIGDLCSGQDCYERLGAGTLTRRHVFDTALDLDINGRFQQRATPARGVVSSIVGSIRLSRSFQDWTFYAGYLIQYANVSKDLVKPLAGSNAGWINRGGGIVSDLTGLIDTGVVLQRVDNPFNPYEGFMATMDIKLASPWLGGDDWWTRIDLSWQHFIPIPRTQERLNFRYTLRYGQLVPFSGPGFGGETVNTKTVPDVWRYYAGGTTDLGLRGILPETMLVDLEEVALPYGGTVIRPRAQGGHIRAIGSIALQVTSVKDIFGGALAHSVFYDFGVLTQFWDKFDLRRDFRHSVGVNAIKLDINIVTMALGYAVLIPGVYNVGPTDDRNGRFVFDVGVTF